MEWVLIVVFVAFAIALCIIVKDVVTNDLKSSNNSPVEKTE